MRLFYVFDGALHRRPNSIADNTQVYLVSDVEALKAVLKDARTTLKECVGLVPMIDGRGVIAVRAGRNVLRKLAAIFEEGK